MGDVSYVANVPLRFGNGYLQPGDVVPIERGRNYGRMLSTGQISLAKTEDRPRRGRPPKVREDEDD